MDNNNNKISIVRVRRNGTDRSAENLEMKKKPTVTFEFENEEIICKFEENEYCALEKSVSKVFVTDILHNQGGRQFNET